MNTAIEISIPTPCHENWEAMNPKEQGRFCKQCSKTVVDFTKKSDSEIMKIIENNAENTCGRFNDYQLDRKLIVPLKTKWYQHIAFKYAAGLLLLFKMNIAKAQGIYFIQKSKGKLKVTTETNNLSKNTEKKYTFKIIDKNNDPIKNAEVILISSIGKITHLNDSVFEITTTDINFNAQIKALGFETKFIDAKNIAPEIILDYKMLEEVIVTAYGKVNRHGSFHVCSFSIVKSETLSCKTSGITISSEKDILKIDVNTKQNFMVYPNPITANQDVNVNYTSAKNEQMMIAICTIDGKFLQSEKVNIKTGKNIFTIKFKNHIATQMVMVQLMNQSGKWVANSKLLIQ